MGSEAKDVVDNLVLRKCSVSSVMANAEYSTAHQPLKPPVGGPETPFDGEDKIRVEILRRQELGKRIDEFSSLRKRIS